MTGMANLMPCPSCGQEVSLQAASCPKCGHPFRSVAASTSMNVWDFVGFGVCGVGIVMFLGGAVMQYNDAITSKTAGNLVVASIVAVVLGLLLMAVGRILAGAGKK